MEVPTSEKEKEEHWLITQLLSHITVSFDVFQIGTTPGSKKERKRIKWVQEPLIEIVGGEIEKDVGYPSMLEVEHSGERLFPNIKEFISENVKDSPKEKAHLKSERN